MPYQLRITDTRQSNTSQWYPGNITFELYRKQTYQDTGKLTIQQNSFDANNNICAYNSDENVKKILIYNFDTEDSYNEYINDPRRIQLNGNSKIESDSSNNITSVRTEIGLI